MQPTPSLVSAVLDLPLEARRLLAQRPGPGWMVHPKFMPTPLCAALMCWDDVDRPLCVGWSWLPADAAEWMEAATPEGGAWTYQTDRGWRIWDPPGTAPGFTHSEILADAESAPSCALAALRARFPTPHEEETP